MKRIYLSIIVLVIISLHANAQKKELSIEDAVINQWRNLYPETVKGVQAYSDDDFTYVTDYKEIRLMNKKGKDMKIICEISELNKALTEAGDSALKYFPFWDYAWKDKDHLEFKAEGNYYIYNLKSKKIETKIHLPKDAENVAVSDNAKRIAYTLKNNLYWIDDKSNTHQITFDEDAGIVNGSSYVHRQEFGIDKGIFWSPDGTSLAFYRKDERMVADYPLVDVASRIASLKNLKYPMTGEKSEEVRLGIYNLNTKKTVFCAVSDFTKERYLTSITWSPDNKYIYIGVLNRGQNHLKLNKYNAADGAFIKTLFEEKNKRYVEPENPLFFIPGTNDKFLCFSERDGYKHLYLYTSEGKLIKQVTKGKWDILDFKGFNDAGTKIYYASAEESPIEVHFYSQDLKKGTKQQLTHNAGTHSVVLSNSKNYLFDSYSSTEVAYNSQISDKKGKLLVKILEADEPLNAYDLGKMTIGTIKAADGKTDLYYRLITPPGFDPKKKYPVVVYVYGGPHAQLVTNSRLGGARLWNFFMAQKGYIMFTIDNRGSANRGFDFESIIHRQCGQEEMKDQMKGIEFLKSKAYVDTERIGVHGWSYGGFMTTSLITNFPETFKVAVAGGPVIDWKYYEVMYGERYMDTPQENPEGYKKTSLLGKAEDLKGRLLMIHGYVDPVVVPQNSLDFIRSCIKAQTEIDYFLYPESEHNMRGKTRLHLMKKVTRYFDDYL